jgi:hypothetical protein
MYAYKLSDKMNVSERKLLTETRDIVIRLEEHMKSFDEKFGNLPCMEHEKRVKELENWKWYIVGISSAVGIFIKTLIDRIFNGG